MNDVFVINILGDSDNLLRSYGGCDLSKHEVYEFF